MSNPASAGSTSAPSGLNRLEFPATGDAPSRGTAIVLHGHGDHAARYEDVLLPFRERGITCFATDQPGHGTSPGHRGAIPDVDAIDAMVDHDLTRARALASGTKPILIGHSAGGLLAMRELMRHPDTYRAAWISSPLVWPERTRHPAMVSLLLFLGRVLPNFQVATGVTESMCRHDDDQSTEANPDPLFHSRITLGWARSLVTIARHVRREFPARHPDIPILITQGDADPVCPANLLREFLSTIDRHPLLQCVEFKDVLHEPFVDDHSEDVLNTVGDWLDRL